MKEEIILKERIQLLEKEIDTLTETLKEINKAMEGLKELELEVRAIKLYLTQVHPDFKENYPKIIKKIRDS